MGFNEARLKATLFALPSDDVRMPNSPGMNTVPQIAQWRQHPEVEVADV